MAEEWRTTHCAAETLAAAYCKYTATIS